MKTCKFCNRRYRPKRGQPFKRKYCSLVCFSRREDDFSVRDIWLRDDKICYLCHKEVPEDQATKDHVIPKSMHGSNSIKNIRLAHFLCNQRRGNMPVEEFKRRMGYK